MRNNFYSIKWRGEAEPAKNGVFGGKKQIFEKISCRLWGGGVVPGFVVDYGGG